LKKLAYLGPKGSNSDQAVRLYARITKMDDFQELPTQTIEEAMIMVENQIVDEAVVPIENSVEGSVNVTLDKLAHSSNLMIGGEFLLPIRYALVAKRNVNQKFVKKIASHPQSIAQCREYIRNQYPKVAIIYTNSTSEAAQMVAQTNEEMLAICSPYAVDLFDLDIIDQNIQDFQNNATRFVIITRNPQKVSGPMHCKLSMVFSTQNQPGRLYEVLEIFKRLKVNLTKIESRPAKGMLGEYIFFADMEMNQRGEIRLKILDSLKDKTTFLKVLGFYPILNGINQQ